MKFKLLLLAFIGTIGIAQAQYTITDRGGNVLHDGDIIEMDVAGGAGASYEFYVRNDNPSQTIYTRIEVIGSEHSVTGHFAELCYGICSNDIGIGDTVPPPSEFPMTLEVGQSSGLGNHFYNDDPGNGTDNVDFTFAFRQYEDAEGTIEINTPLVFTYRYNPRLGVNDNSKVNLTIQSTVVSDQLNLKVNEPVQMNMYDIQGRLVKQARFENGDQTFNVSDLSPQVYIVQFKNDNGAVQTTKIMVK